MAFDHQSSDSASAATASTIDRSLPPAHGHGRPSQNLNGPPALADAPLHRQSSSSSSSHPPIPPIQSSPTLAQTQNDQHSRSGFNQTPGTNTLLRSRSISSQRLSPSDPPARPRYQSLESISLDDKFTHPPGPTGRSLHQAGSRTVFNPFQRYLASPVEFLRRFNPTSLTVSIQPSMTNPSTPSMIISRPPADIPPGQSRWFSPEFCVYWFVLGCSLKLVINATVNLSQAGHPNYDQFKHRLSTGWIFNRKIDNSDSQYRRFRSGLSQLILLSIGYLSLSKLSKALHLRRSNFQSISSALILSALHGTSVIKILFIVGLNYLILRIPSVRTTRLSTILIWFFNLFVLFANDYWDGYQFQSLSASLAFLDAGQYKGLVPRWQIGFNISILRLISYALDYQWAAANNFENRLISKRQEPELENERVKHNRMESDYCFQNYFNYVFYPPLYIAGPIITFNNFMSQMHQKPSSVTGKAILGFLGRFLICFFTLEWILHYMYVVAIKDARAWQGDTPFELGIIGYWNLIIIWLKLLIPWRFFRLWALLDDVDPPENMVRCMSNNYSTLGFWRSWHRSYNLWIVRYLYIPLGGSRNMIPSMVLVFTFVALWHDLSLKLLAWGWLISLFVLPEVIAKKLFSNSIHRNKPWFRHLVALGGTFNVMAMMSANLVGFCIGLDGVNFMWHELLASWSGLRVFVTILFVVFCAVQVMIEYRGAEAKEGIRRKC